MITTLTLLFIAGIANAMMDILKSQWPVSRWMDLPTSHWFYQWAGPSAVAQQVETRCAGQR